MQAAVACQQVGPLRPGQLAEGLVQRIGRQHRVDASEGVAKATFQDGLRVIVALGGRLARGELRAVAHLPAGTLQPGERSLLDGGFVEAAHSITCQ